MAVKYGIIGYGNIADIRIVREGFRLDRSRFTKREDFQLIGVTSRSERRKEAALSLGLKWYDSAEELLKDPAIDAVFIATNNKTHFRFADMALDAGKHVLLEKPLTISAREALDLQEKAKQKNLSLSVNHMMQYNSLNVQAARLVKDGTVGDITDITLHVEFLYGETEVERKAWRCAVPEELGGPIGDVGSHCLYMAEYLIGSLIKRVACVTLPKTLGINAEENAYIQFMCENGIPGDISVAFNKPRGCGAHTNLSFGYEIYGRKAALRSYGTLGQLSGHPDEPVRIYLELDTGLDVEFIYPEDPPNIYASVIDCHTETILSGKSDDGSEGVHNVKLVEACYASCREGGRFITMT